MAYDRADWHYGGEYPEDLPTENGATHIGMFLGWALKRGLAGELHVEEDAEELEQVRNGEMDGREFLIDLCDEKFTEEDLNDEGNAFAKEYFENDYFDDYYDAVDADRYETIYHVENSPENQAKVEALLDERFAAWKNDQAPQPPPPKIAPDEPEPAAPMDDIPPPIALPPREAPDEGSPGWFPSDNKAALWGYYAGIFSLIPCTGLGLGPAAMVLGYKGLVAYREDPGRKGKVHAWVALILGAFATLLNVGALIVTIVNRTGR